MKKELEQLVKLAGTSKFEAALNKAYKKYKDNAEAMRFLSELLTKEVETTHKNLDFLENEISVKMKMKQVSEIISLSYIAKNYFQKSKEWLYQRINGYIVNGKESEFTSDELDKLDFALQDISKKIACFSVRA